MIKKRVFTILAAAVTFVGSAELMRAQETPWTCEQGAQNSFVFLGQCPWDIGGICHTWGMTGPGTVGTCEPLGLQDPEDETSGAFRVTCVCLS